MASANSGFALVQSHHKLLIVAALMLGVLNVWRWFPDQAEPTADGGVGDLRSGNTVTKLPFLVAWAVDRQEPQVLRDLFYAVKPQLREEKPPEPAKVAASVPLPSPSEIELARQAAERELAGFRLVGTVRHAGKNKAFLVKDDLSYVTLVGDEIEGRYRIEEITRDHVVLIDETMQISRTIALGPD